VKHVKVKNDIVWYLWKLAILLVTHRLKTDEIFVFVKDQLALFSLLYQKKYRLVRLKILIYVFCILSSKNVLKYVVNVPVLVDSYVLTTHRSNEDIPGDGLEKDDDDIDDEQTVNCDYLKCFTYIDNEVMKQVAIEKGRVRSKEVQEINV